MNKKYKSKKTYITNQIQLKNKNLHKIIHIKLLKCGDIESNPGPMPNIIKEHSPAHRRRSKTYFILCTTKLHPECQHITQTFSPLLKINHPNHNNASRTLPNLSLYITRKRQFPTPNILFVLITTLSPYINACEHLIQKTYPHSTPTYPTHTR